MMKRNATNLKIFCRVLLALIVVVGGLFASNDVNAEDTPTRLEVKELRSFPASGDKIEAPGMVTVPPVVRKDGEDALLTALKAARLAGDMAQSQALQAQLDVLYGIVPSTTPQMKGDDQNQVRLAAPASQPAAQKWAGDIQIASSSSDEIRPALASAPDGTLYAVLEDNGWIEPYSSTNGGASWNSGWGSLTGFMTGDSSHNPSVTYIEASDGEKWLYVAYEATMSDGLRKIMVYRRVVAGAGSSGFVTVASGIYMPSTEHIAPEIGTDYPIYSTAIYLYVTYAVHAIDYYRVMFSRSSDRGLTWRTPADVTGGAENSGWQTKPDIAFGTAGLFIVFEKLGSNGSTWSKQIWVTQSTNYGTNWGTPAQLTTSTNAAYHPRVSAAIGNNSVLIAYTRDWNNSGDLDIRYAYSTDAGSTWNAGSLATALDIVEKSVELDRSYSGGNFHAAYWQNYDIMYRAAATTTPSSWSAAALINEANWASGTYPKPAVCVNPTKPVAQEAGIAWTDNRGSSYDVYFDAGYISSNSYLLWTK